ncbi:LURP-one-related/scramblase family protein [Streptococcus caviae]|uniref:LURP-one-related/scramblase family protein n=1 Tax=Streptococcus sp. 'caviae' TaxID=1915004 RepID=UPI00094BB6DB|nr:LURP-one-related family protein [Streptococcus sp. 'caviae']OLN84295.1 hypothetical protein BMI76_02735 [Streptococcus sp. 'caviae']
MAKEFKIKEKMWSMAGKFTISDELGIDCYQVEGSLFKIPKTFTVKDMMGNLVSKIEKRVFAFPAAFDVSMANGESFTIRKELTLFKPRYSIDHLGITVQGSFWDMDFELLHEGQVIARISQEWFKLASTYNIQVYDEAYSDLVISLVIAIDYVKELENNSK